jgi:signal transduction histidine kinase
MEWARSIWKDGLLRLERFSEQFLNDNPFVDFKQKHVFTAKLRVAIFLLTWLMYFTLFPLIWLEAPGLPIVFNVCFFITIFSYWFIFRHEHILLMIGLEVVADVISQTSIVYLWGIETGAPIVIYGLYIGIVGVLYGFGASLFASVFCLISYGVLKFLVVTGALPALPYPAEEFLYSYQNHMFLLNWVGMAIILGLIIYAVRIASHFSELKEKALESRHVQLAALNTIGATIRKTLNTENVIGQVLRGVTQGLRFELSILALLDPDTGNFEFWVADENYYTRKMNEFLGISWRNFALRFDEDSKNAICKTLFQKRVVIRNHILELLHDVSPQVDPQKAVAMQNDLGFRKFVMTPLEAEGKGKGVLIGVSTRRFIEDTVIDTLDNFSNQAALAIESAQLFEALKVKHRQMEEALRVKSDFLAIMSHELRTPLNAVMGYSEVLLDQVLGELNEEQQNSVRQVLKSAQNLLDLINNILDLAKLESGKMNLVPSPVFLPELVHDVYGALKPMFDKKHQLLSLQLPDESPTLQGDHMKLRQILVNLLSNANKFTEDKGRVNLKIAYVEKPLEVLAKSFPGHNYMKSFLEKPAFLFEGEDDGVGIAPENLEKIFESFQQGDHSYTRAHEGTGLGLALTRQLVLLHGGALSVESTVGKGSVFRFMIPERESVDLSLSGSGTDMIL